MHGQESSGWFRRRLACLLSACLLSACLLVIRCCSPADHSALQSAERPSACAPHVRCYCVRCNVGTLVRQRLLSSLPVLSPRHQPPGRLPRRPQRCLYIMYVYVCMYVRTAKGTRARRESDFFSFFAFSISCVYALSIFIPLSRSKAAPACIPIGAAGSLVCMYVQPVPSRPTAQSRQVAAPLIHLFCGLDDPPLSAS